MGAALLLALALAGGGRFERTNSRTEQGRSDRGLLSSASYALFEFAPASGLGMPAECSSGGVYGVLNGRELVPLTFARASTGWCTKADYSLVEVSSGQPRVMSGTGGTTPLGLLVEDSATNLVVHSRDLSQAAWTKSSMTCARTATGVDGVANSASTCTASGSGATVTQATTVAAATRNSSMYLRRSVGSGVVEVTRDGSTWHEVQGALSPTTARRVVSVESPGCAYGNCIIVPGMTGGGANPTIGIRLGTSGDAVVVDLVQDEPGAYPTSPITSGATPGVRAAETASVPVSATLLALGYSVLAPGYLGAYKSGVDTRLSGSTFFSAYLTADATELGASPVCYAYTSGGAPVSSSLYVPPLGPTPVRCGLAPGASTTIGVLGYNSTTATVGGSFTSTSISIGGGTGIPNAVISSVCADTSADKCTGARTHPTAIAWVGDSITKGDAAAPARPPAVLRGTLPGRTVYNLGVNSQSSANCKAVALGAVASRAGTLVMLCGVNSLGLGAAAVWADLEAAYTAALGAGMNVVPVLLTPWASAATWNAGLQASQDTVNASISAWCTAHSKTCVDTSSLGTGSPATLLPAYDSGDGLHLSAAGGAALAALVAGANP